MINKGDQIMWRAINKDSIVNVVSVASDMIIVQDSRGIIYAANRDTCEHIPVSDLGGLYGEREKK